MDISNGLFISVFVGMANLSFAFPIRAEVQYRANYGDTIILYALARDVTECWPQAIEGKIARREFADDGMTIIGVILESDDGQRKYINVDPIEKGKISRADLSWIISGLQKLTKEGRKIHGSVMLCGASGSLEYLDSLW